MDQRSNEGSTGDLMSIGIIAKKNGKSYKVHCAETIGSLADRFLTNQDPEGAPDFDAEVSFTYSKPLEILSQRTQSVIPNQSNTPKPGTEEEIRNEEDISNEFRTVG